MLDISCELDEDAFGLLGSLVNPGNDLIMNLLDYIESVSTRMVVVYFNSCLLDSILEVR